MTRSIPKTESRIARMFAQPLALLGVFATCGLAGALIPPAPLGPRYVGAGSTTPKHGGTLVFHHESDLRGLDPFVSFDELSTMGEKLIFESLLDYDLNANFVPRLATRLPDISPDGKVFRFELKKGVLFHNGRELTATDVQWSIEHMLLPVVNSPGATFYAQLLGYDEYRKACADEEAARPTPPGRLPKCGHHVAGIRVTDRYKVEFELKAPDQTFLNVLAMLFASPVPRENYEAHPTDIATHPIGTGPFRMESWEPGMRVEFVRNTRYHRAGEPYLDRLIYELNLAREPAFLRFRAGELDHVHRYSTADYLFLKQSKEWAPYIINRAKPITWGLVMNVEMAPFDNVHVRRAIAFAIDRDRWVRARNGRQVATGQILPPVVPGFNPRLRELQRYDLAEAKRELALAGHPNGLPDSVPVWIGEGNTGRVFGELLQGDLAKIGIRIDLKPTVFPTYLRETGRRKTVPANWGGWSMDYPDPSNFLDVLFHSRFATEEEAQNKSFYKNPVLDALLDRALVETDRDKRMQMYDEAQNIIGRDAPWAIVFNDNDTQVRQPYVHYEQHPVWGLLYRDVWLDLPRRPAPTRNGALGLLRGIFPAPYTRTAELDRPQTPLTSWRVPQ